jgi:hypothetical protein
LANIHEQPHAVALQLSSPQQQLELHHIRELFVRPFGARLQFHTVSLCVQIGVRLAVQLFTAF